MRRRSINDSFSAVVRAGLVLMLVTASEPVPAAMHEDRSSPSPIGVHDLIVESAVMRARLSGDPDLEVFMLFVGFEHDLGGAWTWWRWGDPLVGLETFFGAITDHAGRPLAGLLLTLEDRFILSDRTAVFVRIGSGPSYLGLATPEQGPAGFNFYSRAGGGVRWRINRSSFIEIGYDRSHISHAGLRRSANTGINADTWHIGLHLAF